MVKNTRKVAMNKFINDHRIEFIDIHYHANPDLYTRRYGVMEVGRIYKKLNGAVVLKSHLGSTSVHATIAQQEGLPVFPSIVLNSIVGGIHYRSVIQALSDYQPIIPSKLIVHLPTITGRKYQSSLSRKLNKPNIRSETCKSETVFNKDNELKKEVIDLLKLSRDYPIVISTGHASKEETYALIDACHRFGVESLMLNQPANPMTGLHAPELLEIAKNKFVWVEQTALTYLLNYQTFDDFSEVLKEVPNVIYSSDLGQTTQMNVEEWRNISENWFCEMNVLNERKVNICLTNPYQLIIL